MTRLSVCTARKDGWNQKGLIGLSAKVSVSSGHTPHVLGLVRKINIMCVNSASSELQ